MEGTVSALVITILRNIYYSECRKRRREVAMRMALLPPNSPRPRRQSGDMDLLDFRAALQQLPAIPKGESDSDGASGLSYEEAAGVCSLRDRHNEKPRQSRQNPFGRNVVITPAWTTGTMAIGLAIDAVAAACQRLVHGDITTLIR